jgi:hypothetical protein
MSTRCTNPSLANPFPFPSPLLTPPPQLGIGLRSNAAACAQLMEQDLLGTRRFAVVRDDFDQAQVCRRACVFLAFTL